MIVLNVDVLSTDDVNIVDIAYDGINYVAVGHDRVTLETRVWTSPDCISWTRRTNGITSTDCRLTKIAYGNGIFVAVGLTDSAWGPYRRYAIRSIDSGITWTQVINEEHPAYERIWNFHTVAYWEKNQSFYIGGLQCLYKSSNGISWSSAFNPNSGARYLAIATNEDSIFLASEYANYPRFYYSTTGDSYDGFTAVNSIDVIRSTWNSPEFWITRDNGSTRVVSSYNPITKVDTYRYYGVYYLDTRTNYGIASDGQRIVTVGGYYSSTNTGIYGIVPSGGGWITGENIEGKSLTGIYYNSEENYFIAGGDSLVVKIYFETDEDTTSKYWVSGGGDWNDTNHWSYMSSGPGGAPIPISTDTIHFTSRSFPSENQTVNVSTGEFSTGIITSTCRNFTLKISSKLTCHSEFTMENDSTIQGTFILNNYATWNGTWENSALIETLYCMPNVTIKGNNTITHLILDTDSSSPSANFYFGWHTNQTVQTFNILNTSIDSQACICLLPLLDTTISHSPKSVVTYGEPVTLTWSSIGADMCSIDNDVGIVETSGSTIVYPMIGTTYTITASGFGFTTTANTTIYALNTEYIEEESIIVTSSPVSGSYSIPAPTFSGLSEYIFDIDLPKTLTISCAAPIYYTLDGSTPNNTSSLYSAPISILPEYFTGSGIQTLVVKAVGYDSTIGDYSAVSTSITYKKVPFGDAIIVNRTDTLIEAIVSEQLGSLITTAMPVSGAYKEIVIVQEDYTNELITTAMPVSGAYTEIVIVQEDYTDEPMVTTAMPVSGAYWKVVVEE